MKKLWNRLFYVPKYAKVQEKVVRNHFTATATIIAACLIVMSLTAYAYFTASVTSSMNTIQAANFEAVVEIVPESGDISVVSVDTTTRKAELVAGTYTVTLTHAGTASTGFYKITAENCAVPEYHSQQLYRDAEDGSKTITFQLQVTDPTTLTLQANWGTSAMYTTYVNDQVNTEPYIIGGDTVVMVINGVQPQNDELQNQEPPAQSPAPPENSEQQSQESAETVYTVAKDDTLSAIAQQYNTTVEELAAYNGIQDVNIITVGQQIRIPQGE